MNYGFELMSEIIPLCIVAVLGIDMKREEKKIFYHLLLFYQS